MYGRNRAETQGVCSAILVALFVIAMCSSAGAGVIVTGIVDGTLSGGSPKAIELYVDGTENLINYKFERSANAGAWGSTTALAGTYTDEFVYLVGTAGNGLADFQSVFGAAGDFANTIVSGNVSGNGNDGFRVLNVLNTVVDQVWTQDATNVYQDSYLYRNNATGPDGGWAPGNWTAPGNDVLDGLTAAQIGAAVPFGTYQPAAVPDPGPAVHVVARDDFDAPINLVNFQQAPAPGAFSSAADGFETYQRGVSPTIPFVLLDDSTSIFPGDTLGIIGEAKTDAWFGAADTDNPDNPGGAFRAEWTFRVAGYGNLEVDIDMGAMGDFESSDVFDWTYSWDGLTWLPLLTSAVDEDGSQSYTMDGGAVVLLNDPLLMGGQLLDNTLRTITGYVQGQGEYLHLRLSGQTNGGGEAYAFDNIVIRGAEVPEPISMLLLSAGLTGVGVYARRRRHPTA